MMTLQPDRLQRLPARTGRTACVPVESTGGGGRDRAFAPREAWLAPPLERLAVPRARYQVFLRNVCVAMGNAGEARFRAPLERLAASDDELVAEYARWALEMLLSAAPDSVSSTALLRSSRQTTRWVG